MNLAILLDILLVLGDFSLCFHSEIQKSYYTVIQGMVHLQGALIVWL